MIIRTKVAVFLLSFLISIFPALALAGTVVVIGHKDIPVDNVSVKQAKKLWLGKAKKLPGIKKITVFDQPVTSTVHSEFYSKIVKKKPSQLKAYWAKLSFIGKAFPPNELPDDAAVVKWVASHPGALGYVDISTVNDSVKILLTAK